MNLKEFSSNQRALLNKILSSKSKITKIFSIISILFILIASLLPPKHAIVVSNFPLADKGEHMSAYAVLGMFLFLSFADSLISKKLLDDNVSELKWIKLPFIKTLSIGVSLGILIEILQIFVGRSFEVFDMLADAIGLSIGCAIAIFIMNWIFNSSVKKMKAK